MFDNDQNQDDEREVAFSKPAPGNAMGKLLDELKTKVDPDTSIEFRRIVSDAGTDVARVLRDFVYKTVHGKTFTAMQMDAVKVSQDKLFGTGSFEGLKGSDQ